MELLLALLVVLVAVLGAAVVVLALRRPPEPDVGAAVDHAMQSALHELAGRSAVERRATVDEALVRLQQLNGQQQEALRALAGQERSAEKAALEQHLASVQEAMRTELGRLGSEVQALQQQSSTSLAQVMTTLHDHRSLTQQLHATTQDLREVLANPKRRGQWGERMAEDICRLAGLQENVSYRTQTKLAEGVIPDLTLLLPRGAELHLDAKFPLDSYVAALEAPTEAERERHEAAFVRDVRSRMRDLATRGYATAERSLGYVLLFIPNEGISSFLLEREPGLFEEALKQDIVLCSPSSLYSLLAVARLATDSFRVEQDADRILAGVGAFKEQFRKFNEAFTLVGRRIAEAQKAFDACATTRVNQLTRQMERLDAVREERGVEADTDPEAPLAHVVTMRNAVGE
jgi:DNA recombination protein RmuC